MKSARSPNLRIVPAAIISLESNEITAGIYGCSRDCGRGMIIDDNRRKHMCIYPTARGGGGNGGASPPIFIIAFLLSSSVTMMRANVWRERCALSLTLVG